MPVSDWAGECCFAAVREMWLQQLQVKGSSWGQQLEGKSKQEQDEIGQRFLEQCGAKPTSRGLSVEQSWFGRSSGQVSCRGSSGTICYLL